MQHRGSCSAAPGCSSFGPRLSGEYLMLPAFTFFCIVRGQRDIPQSFLIRSATILAGIPSSFPFSRTYTTVARLKAVLYSFFFSQASLRCISIAVAVERMIFAFFAGADVTLLSAADIVTEEIGSQFDLLMVVIDCAGGVTNSSFFVVFSSRRIIIYFVLFSRSRREKLTSFIASQTERFGFLS